MGQKVSPVGLRTGIIRNWESRWYADKKLVPAYIKEDFLIRKTIKTYPEYKEALISSIEIERYKGKEKDKVRIRLYTAKPGLVIGTNAETRAKVIKALEKITKKDVILNVVEVKRSERSAEIVAQSIATQLENRASFRRVQKMAIQRALKAGALGCKTLISGRLGGAEMARSEGYSEGRVPLQTLKADVDYATAEANTTYGILGVKVWIYNGDVNKGETREEKIKAYEDTAPERRPRFKKPGQRPARPNGGK